MPRPMRCAATAVCCDQKVNSQRRSFFEKPKDLLRLKAARNPSARNKAAESLMLPLNLVGSCCRNAQTSAGTSGATFRLRDPACLAALADRDITASRQRCPTGFMERARVRAGQPSSPESLKFLRRLLQQLLRRAGEGGLRVASWWEPCAPSLRSFRGTARSRL
jgi:hypothetical protein